MAGAKLFCGFVDCFWGWNVAEGEIVGDCFVIGLAREIACCENAFQFGAEDYAIFCSGVEDRLFAYSVAG